MDGFNHSYFSFYNFFSQKSLKSYRVKYLMLYIFFIKINLKVDKEIKLDLY